MSTLTRVLIVVIFVMTLVYLGISAALFSYRVDYKNQLEQETMAHKKTVAENEEIISKLTRKTVELEKNIKSLEGSIRTLEQDLGTARNDLTDWKNNSNKLTNDLTALNDSYEKLQASLTDQIQKNKELNESLEKTVASKDNAVKERTILEEKFLQAQNTIILLEKNLATLEQQYLVQAKDLNQAKTMLDEYKRKAPTLLADPVSVKLVEGKVTAISDKPDLNIIMISVGKNDGVEVGMRFTVYRADKYVAKVQVEKVEAQWAACFSIKEFQADAIRINDNVTTSPY
jgi:DNA repair exonuclease SbcCD ATPase subunit